MKKMLGGCIARFSEYRVNCMRFWADLTKLTLPYTIHMCGTNGTEATTKVCQKYSVHPDRPSNISKVCWNEPRCCWWWHPTNWAALKYLLWQFEGSAWFSRVVEMLLWNRWPLLMQAGWSVGLDDWRRSRPACISGIWRLPLHKVFKVFSTRRGHRTGIILSPKDVETLKSTSNRCVLAPFCPCDETAQFIQADLRNWEVLLVLASNKLGAIHASFCLFSNLFDKIQRWMP